MNEIILIAAMANNRAIGIENRLPWRLPDDLQHFKRLTLGKTIVMGRKTWESLPGLLPDRQHVVISRNPGYQASGAVVVNSIEHATRLLNEEEDLLVVGGANLYQQTLPLADRMHLTEVNMEVEGDAFFPDINASEWLEISREHHPADDRHKVDFDFVEYQKR